MIILCLTKSTLNYTTAYLKEKDRYVFCGVVFGKLPFRSLQESCGCVAGAELSVSVSSSSWFCRALHHDVCSCPWWWIRYFLIHQSINNSLQSPDPTPLTSVGASAQTAVVARMKCFEELRSVPRRSPTVSGAGVCTPSLSWVYLASYWSLQLFHISSACPDLFCSTSEGKLWHSLQSSDQC